MAHGTALVDLRSSAVITWEPVADPIYLTKEGLEKVRHELETARTTDRRRVTEALREARSHGDLRENAAYDEAKLNQGRLEARIRELEYILEVAQIVDRADDAHKTASIGSKVTTHDRDHDEEWTFTLVGAFEADPANSLISVDSPLGKAISGCQVGDVVQVETPGGTVEYELRSME